MIHRLIAFDLENAEEDYSLLVTSLVSPSLFSYWNFHMVSPLELSWVSVRVPSVDFASTCLVFLFNSTVTSSPTEEDEGNEWMEKNEERWVSQNERDLRIRMTLFGQQSGGREAVSWKKGKNEMEGMKVGGKLTFEFVRHDQLTCWESCGWLSLCDEFFFRSFEKDGCGKKRRSSSQKFASDIVESTNLPLRHSSMTRTLMLSLSSPEQW